ncbi:hypothetical protein CHU98_g1504 [Xylaria longipes]|nr:hypothetical protein CHU98_g1504 [Xylaria longipes]
MAAIPQYHVGDPSQVTQSSTVYLVSAFKIPGHDSVKGVKGQYQQPGRMTIRGELRLKSGFKPEQPPIIDEPLSTLEPEESTCAKRVSVCPFARPDGIAGGVSNNYQTAALPIRLSQPFTISYQT